MVPRRSWPRILPSTTTRLHGVAIHIGPLWWSCASAPSMTWLRPGLCIQHGASGEPSAKMFLKYIEVTQCAWRLEGVRTVIFSPSLPNNTSYLAYKWV